MTSKNLGAQITELARIVKSQLPKERPILFSAPMVRALLAGAKTQTRRIVKPQPTLVPEEKLFGRAPGSYWWPCNAVQSMLDIDEMAAWGSPYGHPGDRLWVRESLRRVAWEGMPEGGIAYAADDEVAWDISQPCTWVWKRPSVPSIHMPRGVCRIELGVTDVRVERLHAITEEDARAEGIDTSVVDPSPRGCPDGILPKQYATARDCFADLWRAINGSESWDANPWVWVVTFKRVKPEKDAR